MPLPRQAGSHQHILYATFAIDQSTTINADLDCYGKHHPFDWQIISNVLSS